MQGSSIGRIYPEALAADNPTAILKDLNWLLRQRSISLDPEKKALFEEQLRRDTALLQKLRIMDYSLLTGIHLVGRGNGEGVGLRGGGLSIFHVSGSFLQRLRHDTDASARYPAGVHRSTS